MSGDQPTCSEDGCTRKVKCRGWCGTHYARWLKYGSVELPGRCHDAAARLRDRSVRSGECLLYMRGWVSPFGNRRMSYHGRHELVHRVAWMLEVGPIPSGIFVCHRCDVPNCVNVAHLFLGTAADNNADRDLKGRGRTPRGSKSGKAKLSEWQIQEIRQKLRQGRTLASLGEEYGVAWQTISSIKYGHNWKHVRARS